MLPFGSGHKIDSRGFSAAFVEGWQFNAILSRTSGSPFTVTSSATSLNAPGNSQFANQLTSKVRILGGHDATHPYFDPTAFSAPTTAAFGSAGRNGLRGPGFFNLSTGLSRTFTIEGRYKFQIRAEAFNLTNTPHFGNPGSIVSSQTSTSLNGFAIINSASNQREIRLAGRFTF